MKWPAPLEEINTRWESLFCSLFDHWEARLEETVNIYCYCLHLWLCMERRDSAFLYGKATLCFLAQQGNLKTETLECWWMDFLWINIFWYNLLIFIGEVSYIEGN